MRHWILFIPLILLISGCKSGDTKALIPILISDCSCSNDITKSDIKEQLTKIKTKALKREIDPEKGLSCAEKLLAKIREESIDFQLEFLVLKLKSTFGVNLRSELGLAHAKEAAEDMLLIGNKTESDNIRANAYSRLHTLYAMQSRDGGVGKKEVEYLLKARVAARASSDTLEILNNLQHAQIMAMKLMDQTRLLELSEETLALSNSTNPAHQKYRVFAHKHIGYHYYAFEDNYSLAEEHLLEGHRLAKEYLAPVHVGILAKDLIALYSSNNYPEKLKPFVKDVQIPGRLPFDEAYIAYANKDYKKAEKLIFPILTTQGLAGNKGLILRFHAAEMLRLIHKTKKNYEQALTYSDLKNRMQDSINQISLRSQTEVLLFEEQLRTQEESLTQKDEYIANLILGIITIGIQLFLLAWLLLSLRKRKKMLEFKKGIIEAQNAELISANKNLDSFARVASHDLRSPLRNIHFYCDILQRELPISEKISTYFENIRSSGIEMGILLDDILEYSRAAEQIKDPAEVDLNVIIDRVKENLSADIKDKNASLISELLPTIMGHPGRIYQVFQNLISNSLKYQHLGRTPQIELSAQKTESGWTVILTDNGKGIPEESIQDLFEEYKRIDIDPAIPGSGLGLAIVKRHVEAHQGTISVNSILNEGTTFSIHFPTT